MPDHDGAYDSAPHPALSEPDINLRVPEAVWWAEMPSYEQLEAIAIPGFFASGLKGSGANRFVLACRVAPRLLRRPGKTLRAVSGGKRLHELLRFALWLESARFFGVSVLREPDLSMSVLSRFLPLPPRRNQPVKDPNIVASIITQNRSAKLRVTLGCIKPLTPAVVVVDGGSTDDTRQVALAAGAMVIHRPFDQDFSAQRNAAIQGIADGPLRRGRSQPDWILRIDDDETFGSEFVHVLRALLARATHFDTVVVPFHTFTPERWPVPATVAVAVRPWLRYRYPVHEQPTWQRPLFCPLSFPGLENRKSYRDLLVAGLLYHSIRPSDFPPDFEEEAKRLLAELDTAGGDG